MKVPVKKRAARLILNIAAAAVFILCLCNMNSLVLIGHRQPCKVNGGYGELTRNIVVSSIDRCYPMNNLLEEVYVEGWAVSDAQAAGGDRRIGITLADEEGNVYLCDTDAVYDRGDVRQYFEEQGRALPGGDHGFSIQFSVLQLPDGRYRVGVYCREDPDHYGTDHDKEIVLEKQGKDVTVTEWTSSAAGLPETAADLPDTVADDLAVCTVDDVEIRKDGSAVITGWAWITGQDSNTQERYVLLAYADGTAEIYDTLTVSRIDVANAWSSDLYIKSGFRAEIGKELLHSENFKAYALVRDGDGLHMMPLALKALREELEAAPDVP